MKRRAILLAAAACAAAAPGAGAQHIEALAELHGRTLPAEYYERVGRQPDFFGVRPVWQKRLAAAAADPAGAHVPVREEYGMVVMLGLYSDSPEPAVSSATVHERLFGANPRGNVTDYYREVSRGQVNVTGTVLPWVRTGLTRAQVAGRAYGLGADGAVGPWMRQVLERLDATVDFGRFDNDGPDGIPNSGDDDGFVDLPVFQYPGPDATCAMGPAVWPHASGLMHVLGAAYATNDRRAGLGSPVRLDGYIMQSATNCDGTPQDISIIAHEAGHAFGLPDFYDASNGLLPGQRRWVLGCWTLMAAGGWGCGAPDAPIRGMLPPHMGAFEKAHLGWAEVRTAEPGWRRSYTLGPVQRTGEVLRVPLRGPFEYLLLEYRPNIGFDADLPAGGVLAYHVDSLRPFRISCNGCRRIYHVGLIEADGDGALLRSAREGGDRGSPGDVFTGRRVLDTFSHPALVLNSGYAANVALEIEVVGEQARIIVSTLPQVPGDALLAPLLGTAGRALQGDERLALDHFGNRNGRYDLGDLRAYMRSRPQTVVPPA